MTGFGRVLPVNASGGCGKFMRRVADGNECSKFKKFCPVKNMAHITVKVFIVITQLARKLPCCAYV